MVALGRGLRTAGHAVRVLSDRAFEPMIEAHGLEFVPMSGDMKTIFGATENPWLKQGDNPLALAGSLLESLRALIPVWFDECIQATRDADVMLTSGGTVCMAGSIHEKTGIPFVRTLLQPLTPTREFSSSLMPQPPVALPGFLNLTVHTAVNWLFWMAFRGGTNHARATRLALPPWPLRGPWDGFDRCKSPAIYGFSSAIVPRPADWPDNHEVTGYWFLDGDDAWSPPESLVRFLEAGPAPVYVGFGSMVIRDPEQTTRLVLEAIERSGQRAVLASGWGGLRSQALPPHVHLIDAAPHDWLLPRMCAAVHHGGAGTTAAAARAGIPSVIVPFIADQPFWGARMYALGVAPRPLSRRRVNATRLGQAITTASGDEGMRDRARALGRRIRAEDGVRRAVDLIARVLQE